MKIQNIIRQKILSNINVISLDIIDESEKHFGHSGYNEEGESHFFIKIISNDFVGMNKVARHRLLYKILDNEIKNHIHALSLELLTDKE